MRILMLSQFYPPMIGGEERHVRDLSIALAARGHHVAVATLWHKGLPEFECDQGVSVYRIRASMPRFTALFSDPKGHHSPPFPDPEGVLALRRLVKEERPDIVHAHNWLLHTFTPIKVWSKAKFVVTLHDCSLVCAQQQFMNHGKLCDGPDLLKCLWCASHHYGPVKGMPVVLALQFWRERAQRAVDMFLAVSRAIAEISQLKQHHLPYQIIPNFIRDDLGALPADVSEKYLAQLPPEGYLLFVGNIGRAKGVDTLLEAYAGLNERLPLVLIGPPVLDFPTPELPNVHVLHSWPHAAVMHALSRCTISLIPSACLDACPTVAMEAMAMGRPVIASRIGGLPDIVVDGETGLIVPPGDAQKLRDAIQYLLDNPEQRACMGAAAKQRVADFQIRTVIPRIEEVYQKVLQG
ncbi:MAG: glycosyltransferase family 4 protein [Ktedonobacteraceae bacterium]|nr:glycosyltransferase family 4 protein [Ktedonobacteraceae bacterium]